MRRAAADAPGTTSRRSRRSGSCGCCAGGWCRPGRRTPSIGNRMINARMETVAEKPAFKRAFAKRRCLLPADGYFEWYPTAAAHQGRQAAQAAVLHPPRRRRRAGDGRALRDLARPDPRRRRPRAVPLDLHGAHHRGRGRRRPHPRPDAADGRARALGRLARPDRSPTPTTCSALLVPAAPGRLEAYPVVDAGQQRAQQRSRAARRPAAEPLRTRGPGSEHRGRASSPTPHGDARLVTDRSRPPGRHAAARPRCRRRRSTPATSRRWPRYLPRQGITVVRLEQPWRVAGTQDRHRARQRSTTAWSRPPTQLRVRTPLVVGGRSAGARSAARCAARSSAPPAASRSSFPLHPPGRPERSRLDELRGGPGADPGGPGGARRRWAVPRSSPTTSTCASSPARTTGSRCRRAAPCHQEEAMAIVVEATLEWIVREVDRRPADWADDGGGDEGIGPRDLSVVRAPRAGAAATTRAAGAASPRA